MQAVKDTDHPFTYKRHEPEKTLLFQVLASHWRTWLADRQQDIERSPLPNYVVREVDAFLRCGILSHGFTLLSCKTCEHLAPVAFSCKHRGFCPSCAAKRAAETTTHLIDNVLPHAPYRQWVTTFPYALRFWLATNCNLTATLHRIVTNMIVSYYEHQAEQRGIKAPHAGGVTFIQRFGSALNLNVHFHTIALEGVYSTASGVPVFYQLPGPSDEDVSQIVQAVAGAAIQTLQKKGYLNEEGTPSDPSSHLDKVFAASEQMTTAMQASAAWYVAFGERRGKKVRRIGRGFGDEDEQPLVKGRRLATANGFTIHANRYLGPQERQKLEELIAYGARGAFSHQRLTLRDPENPGGDLVYRLKTPWADGTEAILLSPTELIEKIVALIPPPYLHLSRYFGILSSHSQWRRQVILKPHVKKGFVASDDGLGVERLSWSKLLKRTFRIDIMRCPACGAMIFSEGREVVVLARLVESLLRALGLNYHPPPIATAKSGPNLFDADPIPPNDVL